MALTITNHLVRSADAPSAAGFGDGGGIVIRLPASQIPADCNPEVYDEGFWSRVSARVGQFGLTGPAGIVQASGLPGAG